MANINLRDKNMLNGNLQNREKGDRNQQKKNRRPSDFGEFVRLCWKRIPLFSLILLTCVVFSIAGWVGLITNLKSYRKLDFVKEPFYSALIFDLKTKLNGGTEVTLPPDAVKKGAETETKKESVKTPSRQEMKKAEDERLTIPKGVCDKVIQAKDYGVANQSLLVDPSTVFTTDLTGYFAPDGTYRYLEKARSDDYFKDALMIGDSRTVGLSLWSPLAGKTNFFCKESMSVFGIMTKELNYTGMNGESGPTTLDQLLSTHTYRKIYISLGINEMGYPIMKYYNGYRALMEKIHAAQPNAIIFIEGNLHVDAAHSQTDATFNNTSMVLRNTAIASLANGRDTFYIDPNKEVCDGNGNLIADYTTDGIHLKAAFYKKWVDVLRDNTIDPDKPAKAVSTDKAQ